MTEWVTILLNGVKLVNMAMQEFSKLQEKLDQDDITPDDKAELKAALQNAFAGLDEAIAKAKVREETG